MSSSGKASGGGGDFGGNPTVLASGQWSSLFPGANRGVTVAATQQLLAFPFLLANAASINSINVNVNSIGAAGSTVRLGLYDSAAGLPAALLADWGTVAGDTSGDKAIVIAPALALAKGHLYFLAYCAISAAAMPSVLGSYSSLNQPGTPPVDLPTGAAAALVASGGAVVHNAAVAGALPALFVPTYTTGLRDVPAIAVKAA